MQDRKSRPAFSSSFSLPSFSFSCRTLRVLPHSSHLLSLISGTLIYGELKRLSITVTVLPSYHFMKIDR